MPISKYDLPRADRKAAAKARAQGFKEERFAHVLNKKKLQAQPASDERDAAIAAANAAISTIEAAIDSMDAVVVEVEAEAP
jgi:hypothetical protein